MRGRHIVGVFRLRSTGFTLLEVLVTVAVLVVLLALLLPTLARVRTQATAVSCAARLRDIAQLAFSRASERRGVTFIAGSIEISSDVPLPVDLSRLLNDHERQRYDYVPTLWSNDVSVEVAPPAMTLALHARTSGAVTPVGSAGGGAATAMNFFFCPGALNDRIPGQQHIVLNFASISFVRLWGVPLDYAINEYVSGWSRSPMLRQFRHGGRLGGVARASEVIWMADAGGAMVARSDPSLLVWQPQVGSQPVRMSDLMASNGRVSGPTLGFERHRGRANLLMSDGHIETLSAAAAAKSSLLFQPR